MKIDKRIVFRALIVHCCITTILFVWFFDRRSIESVAGSSDQWFTINDNIDDATIQRDNNIFFIETKLTKFRKLSTHQSCSIESAGILKRLEKLLIESVNNFLFFFSKRLFGKRYLCLIDFRRKFCRAQTNLNDKSSEKLQEYPLQIPEHQRILKGNTNRVVASQRSTLKVDISDCTYIGRSPSTNSLEVWRILLRSWRNRC